MVSVCFALVFISMGSPAGPLRLDSRHRHDQAEIRAVSVDRSGEAIDLREDPSSTFEMGASESQCICHVLEPLKSSFAVEGLGDACTCADNEAGVVQDSGCACMRTGSLDPATGMCVCEHARKVMRDHIQNAG